MGPYKLQQPPRWWSRQHEPTSIMANVQQKVMYRFWIYSTHGYDFLKYTYSQNLASLRPNLT